MTNDIIEKNKETLRSMRMALYTMRQTMTASIDKRIAALDVLLEDDIILTDSAEDITVTPVNIQKGEEEWPVFASRFMKEVRTGKATVLIEQVKQHNPNLNPETVRKSLNAALKKLWERGELTRKGDKHSGFIYTIKNKETPVVTEVS